MEHTTEARIQLLRNKAREGPLSKEEITEVIRLMRADRERIPVATGGSRTKAKAKAAKPDGDALLDELDGL